MCESVSTPRKLAVELGSTSAEAGTKAPRVGSLAGGGEIVVTVATINRLGVAISQTGDSTLKVSIAHQCRQRPMGARVRLSGARKQCDGLRPCRSCTCSPVISLQG